MKTSHQLMKEASDKAVEEFLANGGKIEYVPTGKSGQVPGEETNVWGRRVKKKEVPTVEQNEEDED